MNNIPGVEPGAELSPVDDNLIDLAAEDTDVNEHDARRLEEKRQALGGEFFSNLINALVGIERSEADAEALWEKLLQHKYHMSQQLGRNVGIRVAAMDYFSNIATDQAEVRIVDNQTLLRTQILAITDGLTGMYNHRYFHDRLREEIERASEADEPLSIIMLDIDNFKIYNDINGHVAGDVALHQVGELVRHTVGEEGICARYGGEEFGVILPACGKQRAGKIAENIRAAVEGQSFPNEFVLPNAALSVSLGVSEFPLDATDRRGLIDYADRAMYESKRSGKNSVCIMAPNRRREPRRHADLPLLLRTLDESRPKEELDVRSVDFSAGGILCRTGRSLRALEALEVELPPEVCGGRAATVVAVVTRSARTGSANWNTAMRFVQIEPAVRAALGTFAGGDD